MDGAGQLLSTVRVLTSTGRRLATLDLITIVNRLSAPVRMVPRRVLLERLLEGFPSDRIRCTPVRSAWSLRTAECASSSKTAALRTEI
jgi:FAD-dependent urate hydroxylase